MKRKSKGYVSYKKRGHKTRSKKDVIDFKNKLNENKKALN